MSICNIPQDVRRLSIDFTESNGDYGLLANQILENQSSGYFYNIAEVADKIENQLLKGEQVSPFSKQHLINTFHNVLNNNKIFSKHEFFDKPIIDLYKNGNEAMQYMINSFEKELVKIAFIDPEASVDLRITLNDSVLNNKTNNFKNKLFKSLFDHLASSSHFKKEYKNIPFVELFTDKRFNTDSNYHKIMNDIAILFKDYNTNISIYNDVNLVSLDVYNAAIMLTNFDKLIESKFSNILSVNQYNTGALTNPPYTFQYMQEFKGISTTYWRRDSHDQEGAENYASNFMKMLAGNIALLDIDGVPIKNQYLGMNRVYLIAALVKSLNNSPETLENFQDNPKEGLRTFLEILIGKKKLEHFSAVNSLYDYLYGKKGVVKIINSAKLNYPDLAPSIIDIEAIIAHQLNNNIAPTYGIYSNKEGKKLLNLVDRESKGDEIMDAIVKHIMTVTDDFKKLKIVSRSELKTSLIYFNGNIVDTTYKSNLATINSLVSDLTGVDITPTIRNLIKRTEQGNIEQAVTDLLVASNEIAKTFSGNKDSDPQELRKILSSNPFINSLITSLVASLSPEAVMQFKSTKGNSIPTVKQSNLGHEKKTTREIAKKEFGKTAGILFLENPALHKGTETVLEVATGEDNAVSALYLNPEENFFLNFTENYIKPMSIEKNSAKDVQNFLSFKLVNFSDKSTILNDLVDQNHPITFKGQTIGTLKEMSIENLKGLTNDVIYEYYSHITDRIIESYARLQKADGSLYIKFPGKKTENYYNLSIDKINNFLEENSKELKSIIKSNWLRINKLIESGDLTIKPILFVDEVHHSKYGKELKFNKVIQGYLERTTPKATETINNLAEQLFVRKLVEIGFSSTNTKLFNLPDSKQAAYINKLYSKLGLDSSDWVNLNNGVLTDVVYFKISGEKYYNVPKTLEGLDLSKLELNPIFAKWLHTQNLVRYSSLGLTTKHEYQHPHKSDTPYNEIKFVDEVTARSIAMTKRMVIHPATMEYYLQGLDEGIPPKIKLAVMDDIQSISYDFTGKKKRHDAMDGSLWASPFLGFLLKKSLPNKGLTDVQKAIGTYSSDTHSVFLKCALFTLTNEMVRKSMGSSISLDNVMKTTHNIKIEGSIDLTRNSLGNKIKLGQFISDGIYFKSGKRIMKVESLEKISGNEYKINMTHVNSPRQTPVSINKKINNLYDLWQVFGGAYSMSLTAGKYTYSEASVDTVGNLMAIVKDSDGNTVLKDKMIGILAQKSAVKNGASNINPASALFTGESLMHTDFDTHFLGVQLDAYHISDESSINEISQVISALAENQSTPELYSELYKAIGNIIDQEIKAYNKANKIDGKYNLDKITKDFIRTIKNSDQIGNANEIIDLLVKLSIKQIPISNNNFFKPFVIDVISRLKTDFIKRKYPGVAAVLNPSYGSIQIYEDSTGKTYFHDDLYALAMEEELSDDLTLTPHEQHKLVSQKVIDRICANVPISADNIKPLDTISVLDLSISDKPEVYNLNDIEEYYKVKKLLRSKPDVVITRVHNKPRDLKPVEISFTQNGVLKNVFDTDPIKLSWAYSNNTLEDKEKQTLLNFINYFGNKDGLLFTNIYGEGTKSYLKGKLKLWNQRAFELLGKNLAYKEVNENTNFEEMFGEDDLVSKLDLANYAKLDSIENYVHKPAEVIMPKIHRSEFNLGTDSFAKINKLGVNYFRNKIAQTLEPSTFDCDLFLASSSGNTLYISILTPEEIISQGFNKLNITTKEIEGRLYRTDIKGNSIYELTSFAEEGGIIVTPEVYTKEGVEYIIFPKRIGKYDNVTNFIKKARNSYEFIYPFAANTSEDFNSLLEIAERNSLMPIYKSLLNSKAKGIQEKDVKFNEGIDATITALLGEEAGEISKTQGVIVEAFENIKTIMTNKLAQSMFASWQKSNDVVAARIPSQAMQSFMSMKNIGYIEEPGNNVYVSHWQLWLQGSDFDIDKAYIMMHGFRNGIYKGWSPFFNYDSYDNIKLSEQLPIPNGNKYTLSTAGVNLAEFTNKVLAKDPEGKLLLPDIIELLKIVRDHKTVNIPESIISKKLLGIINRHNEYEYSTSSVKNLVVRNIAETSNHPNNQIASYSPIDFGKYEIIKKNKENNFQLSLMDGISMDQQQQTNAVGKDVIGIAANGIKDYFALIEYFSYYYKLPVKKTDSQYFERSFNLDGREIKVNRIAGLKLENSAINILNGYLNNALGVSDLFNPNTDPALVLSSLLSAATDNAKELILKTINAGKEFASMHLYLIILGFDEGEVAGFMTNPENANILNVLKHNIFTSDSAKPNLDKAVNKESTPKEFKKIFNLSKELSSLAAILKINQGMSSSAETIYRYFQNIENDYVSRELQFISDTNTKENTKPTKEGNTLNDVDTMVDRVITDKPYLVYDRAHITNIINRAEVLEISNGGFSFEKFHNDEVYKTIALEYYNLIKGTFNLLDVVDKLAHFKGMINATRISYDHIKSLSKKFTFVAEIVPKILLDSGITSSNHTYRIEGTNKINLSEDQLAKAFNVFDDLVISKWLKTRMGTKTINLNKVKTQMSSKGINWNIKAFDKNSRKFQPILNEDIIINFKDDVSLANYKKFVEDNLVPYLKKTYPDNNFLKGLIVRKDTFNKEKSWLSTKVRMGKALDPKNLDVLFNYQEGLDILDKENIIMQLGDNEFRATDLFFLYNLIVNKDRSGTDRLTRLFKNYISDSNSLAADLYTYYSNIDSGDENLFEEDYMNDIPLKKAITFGILNKKGTLYEKDNGTPIKSISPDFTMITGIFAESLDNKKLAIFENLLNLIKNKNLLINFNCE